MRVGGFFIFLIGLTAGVGGGWVMHHYPDIITTEGTYCRLSGARMIVTKTGTYMGSDETTQILPGPLGKMMFEFNGDHPYEWILPRTYLPPTRPEPELQHNQDLRNELLKHKLRDLEYLNHWPRGLSILYAAMENNSYRAVTFVQKILEEHNYLDVNVLLILDRPGSWQDRWADLDTFLNAYRCEMNTDSVRCTVTWKDQEQVLFLLEGAAVENTSIDWQHWPNEPKAAEGETKETVPSSPPPLDEKPAEAPAEAGSPEPKPTTPESANVTAPTAPAKPPKKPAETQN